jgi:hypothetical protein
MKYRIIMLTYQDKTEFVAERWGLQPSIRYGWITISRNNTSEEAEERIKKFHNMNLKLKQQKPITEVIKEFILE